MPEAIVKIARKMRAMAQMLHYFKHDKTTLKTLCCESDGSGNPFPAS